MYVMTGDYCGYDQFMIHNADGGAQGFADAEECFAYVMDVYKDYWFADDPITPADIKVVTGRGGFHYSAEGQIQNFTAYWVG